MRTQTSNGLHTSVLRIKSAALHPTVLLPTHWSHPGIFHPVFYWFSNSTISEGTRLWETGTRFWIHFSKRFWHPTVFLRAWRVLILIISIPVFRNHSACAFNNSKGIDSLKESDSAGSLFGVIFLGQLSWEIVNQIADALGTSVLGCTSLLLMLSSVSP